MAAGSRGVAALVVGRGPREVERLVLADLEELLGHADADPTVLTRPVRVVVPSGSLREHVAGALVRSHARAVTGVVVETLHGLARGVLERLGEAAPWGEDLLGVLVGRAAQREPLVRRELGDLRDGYSSLVGTVRDLLDAGFTPARREALTAAMAATEGLVGPRELERAEAIVAVATDVAHQMESLGLGREPELLGRAARLISEDPQLALPARAILIHGLAEATAGATSLLLALVGTAQGGLRAAGRSAGAPAVVRVYLDEPPDPAEPGRADLGVEFMRRLRERLSVTAVVGVGSEIEPPEDAAVAMFHAPGCDAEVREVGRRIRRLLDGGAAPESIGVVARDLEPYQAAIEAHLGRLGVPFSCRGAPGLVGPRGTMVWGLLELLTWPERTSLDAWLSLVLDRPTETADLRLALRARGVIRLADLAALEVPEAEAGHRSVTLPIRHGFEVTEEDGEEEGEDRAVMAPRRMLATSVIVAAVATARRVLALLGANSGSATLSQHLGDFRRVLLDELGWKVAAPGVGEVVDVLERLAAGLPGELELRRDEVTAVLASRLREVSRSRIGGEGGGVQVLSVVEARARVFEHLFVIGLNRGSFPRQVSEDPLLPDRIRMAVGEVLPEMPVKRRGFDEERYLFAQLLASTPDVTLSWRTADDSGKALAVSPLVERLLIAPGRERPGVAAELYARPAGADTGPWLAGEAAVLTGLYGSREKLGEVLSLAILEGAGGEGDGGLASELANARLGILAEIDPDLSTAAGRERGQQLGPYLGFIGRPTPGADPRGVPGITAVAAMARCPWQTFLRVLLRLEAPPDPQAGLPVIGARLVGTAVHEVLERVVREVAPEPPTDLALAATTVPVQVPWPARERLVEIVTEVAERCARREGIALEGVREVLRQRMLELLQVVRDVDWDGGSGSIPVVGVETTGEVVVVDGVGEQHAISFRADRVDRRGGTLVLTDYKTGKPLLQNTTEDGRRRELLRKLQMGEALQVAAYSLATTGVAPSGRLLSIRPDIAERVAREVIVSAGDGEVEKVFVATAGLILRGWALGSFFPRLTESDGRGTPAACNYCEVAQACMQPDSGARARLARAMRRLVEEADEEGSAVERAAAAIWRLADARRASRRER